MRVPTAGWVFVLGAALAGVVASCRCGGKPPNKSLLQDGDPCQTDSQCQSSFCQALPGQPATCMHRCEDICTPDQQCESLGALNDPRYTCVPAKTAVCKPCTTSSDCPYPGDICYTLNSQTVCGQDCSYDFTCPTGYTCTDETEVSSNVAHKQCVPASGSCDCTTYTAGQTRGCQVKNSFGTCNGTEVCAPNDGGWVGCTARTPAQEVCDGIDNDCNGLVDGQDPNLVLPPCEKQLGVCAGSKHSAKDCVDGGWSPCTATDYGPNYQPTPEQACDHLDNDCNGTVDDGNAPGNVNECGSVTTQCTVLNGTPICATGCVCQIGSCNPPYANCDGKYTSGCNVNLNTDPNNCGTCNHMCTFTNANALCVAGVCQQGACDPNWWTVWWSNGACDYNCTQTSTTDKPDLSFVDENCDGIDGDINGAIFVDTVTGNDGNPGTIASPKQTIGAGILAAAAATPVKDVYISKGTYAEAITLVDGVSLYGGYDAANTWQRATANTTTIQSPTTVGIVAQNLTVASNEVQLVTVVSASASVAQPNGDGSSSIAVLVVNSNTLTLRGCTLRPGNGFNGSAGADGSPGAPGAIGGNASGSTQGGGGGSNCGAIGGAGGPGVTGPAPGDPGSTGTQAAGGGVGGTGGGGGNSGSCSSTTASSGGDAPLPGSPGGPPPGGQGATGTNGAAAANFGVFDSSGNYLPPSGNVGGPGSAGGGGGGGGSGGGSAHGTCGNACTDCVGLTSGAGGGGGGGGCGGSSGSGGRGGGGSFAIVVVGTSFTPVVLDTDVMATGSGGSGGSGGNGGLGGNGGAGGNGAAGQSFGGSSCFLFSCNAYSAGNGAYGSQAGAGGRGGGAAGGTGGPSVCVAYKGVPLPTLTNSTCTTGVPSSGGPGGSNGIQAAQTGATGVTAPEIQSF